jgi:hypothetical protein
LILVSTAVAQETLVPIAPCRLLDTATQAPGEIDVRASRCGRIVPPYATAYSLRVTRISRTAPENLPAGAGAVVETARRVPAPANGRLSFPVTAEDSIGVDVVGYYLAAKPQDTTTDAIRSGEAVDEGPANLSGSAGHVYVDNEIPPNGVYLRATAASPYITAQLGNNTGTSGFYFYNSTSELMNLRSDGALTMKPVTFLDGRTDFFGTPGTSSNGYVPIPTNIVHDVTLNSPRDANNSNAGRVVFFNAWTDDEYGSPPITKFRARSGGYYSQPNVNFDSSFHWHTPNQYHFRAVSTVENNKETFWVKAATNFDSVTQTRADMYVSGRVGIGTPTPGTHFEVVGNDTNARGTTVQINSGVGAGPEWSNQVNITNTNADYGLLLGFNGPGRVPMMYHQPNGAHVVNVKNGPLTLGTSNEARVTVTGAGNVGIGTTAPMAGKKLHVVGDVWVDGAIRGTSVIGATYQDLAEWVPATADMLPGTVAILNPEKTNEVMPSVTAYDTRVAGVVSAQPGLLLGEGSDAKEMIATTGRVKVRVDARRTPIAVGDLLVTSDEPGTAMKSEPMNINGRKFHQPGTIIGKALEPLAGGQGEILVLLSLQ